jgi:hypothetical protein
MAHFAQTARHIRAHPPHPDKTDSGGFHRNEIITPGEPRPRGYPFGVAVGVGVAGLDPFG